MPAGTIEGGTTLEIVKNSDGEKQIAIVMSITSDPNAVHELVHAYQAGIEKSIQLSNSGAAFPGRNLYAQQITNAVAETEAYMAQYGLDPTSMPPSIMGRTPQTMNAIGAPYVGGIYNNSDQPQPVYPNVEKMVQTIYKLLRIL